MKVIIPLIFILTYHWQCTNTMFTLSHLILISKNAGTWILLRKWHFWVAMLAAEYIALMTFLTKNKLQFTNGRPSPARAQLTPASFSRNTSATGDTRLLAGKSPCLQEGHRYPAGAVVGGSCRANWSKHAQWYTSVQNNSQYLSLLIFT